MSIRFSFFVISSFCTFLFAQNHTHRYQIGSLDFDYGGKSDDLPSLTPLLGVNLSVDDQVFSANELTKNSKDIFLDLRGLQKVSQLPLQYLKSLGYEGLIAFPDPNQIDPVSGKDLRPSSDRSLRIVIWVSRLNQVEFTNAGMKESVFKRLSSLGERNFNFHNKRDNRLKINHLRFWKSLGSRTSRTAITNLLPTAQPGVIKANVGLGLRKKQGGRLFATNSGTDSTGNWILGGVFFYNQVTDLDDDLEVSYISSDTHERQALNLKHSIPVIYPDVLNFETRAGYSFYDASSFAITRIDFEGNTKTIELNLRYSPTEWDYQYYQISLEIGVKGEALEAKNSLISGDAAAQLLTPKIAVNLTTHSQYVRSFSKLEVSKNYKDITNRDRFLFGGYKTDEKAARLNFDSMLSIKAGKWMVDNMDTELEDSWNGHLALLRLSASLGLEDTRYMPQHQFISGGSSSVRGYPESIISGDHGYFLSLDYQIPVYRSNKQTAFGSYTSSLIPFIDWGESFVNDPLSYESDHSILGAGLGVEVKFSKGLKARLDFAKPVKEIKSGNTIMEGTNSSDNRVHGMLTWEF
jgi:hemolysin activation/secretion protein